MVPRLSMLPGSGQQLPVPATERLRHPATVPASAPAAALALAQVWLPLCGLRVLKIVKHSTGKLSTDLWPAMEQALPLELPLSMLSVLQSGLIFGRLSARLTGPRTGVSGCGQAAAAAAAADAEKKG